MEWFEKFYRLAVFDYGSEVEVRIYPAALPCPGSGESHDTRPKWERDTYIESFEPNRYGEYYMMRVHDLEEVLDREERSRSVSLNRTRNKVYGISRGNEWEWFCTFTFSPDVVDRYDYDAVSALMVKWLHNMRQQSSEMMYVVVPELHKDGAFHFHGLFSRCAAVFRLKYFRDLMYNIGSFVYGYTIAVAVANPDAASHYISKYITKDLCAVSAGRRRYWSSRNVSFPEPMRCKVPDSDLDRLSSDLYRSARYSSTALSPDGEVQYFHFKAGEIPDDVMRFLKLYAIE